MSFDAEADRCGARLPCHVRKALVSGDHRLVVVGARGWIGRTLLDLLDEALEGEALSERVVAFGSSAAEIVLPSGQVVVQHPLSRLVDLPRRPTFLFHLAFLTKDKVSGMAEADYIAANRTLSGMVLKALDVIGVNRVFLASSGAADFAQDDAAAADLRLYGALKQEDEESFAAWAMAKPDVRMAIVARIYAVSGPHINKHDTYALANFILRALKGKTIEVHAPVPVYRGYVAVRDLLSLVLAQMHLVDDQAVIRFTTGGTVLELGDVARRVAAIFPVDVERQPVLDSGENRYVGDDSLWRTLLAEQQIQPLDLDQQIVETAAFLLRHLRVEDGKALVSRQSPC